jgi:hypothetical protein
VKNNNAEFNKDMTQEVIHAYKETYGVSDQEAGKAVLNGDANAQKVFRQISGEKADAVLQQIKQTESSLNNSNSTDEFMQKNEHEVNKKPGAAGGEVDRFKQDNGMMPEADVVRLLNESKVTMGKTVKDNKNFTSDMYEDAQDINKFKLKNRKSDIAKLEDDRMGNGVISKFIGGAANFLTLGNAGGGIGRPSYVPISYNTQTDSTSDTYSTVRTLPNSIALRPSEGGFRSQDLANTQSLLDQFNPDNNSPDNKGESVDSTKVRKS